jgi:TRAP-type C4-dicarboxylate transport system permease small subunit
VSLNKILAAIDKGERILAMFLLGSCTLIAIVGAFFRAVGHPLNWAMDLAMFFLSWCVFIGGDVAFRHSRLVNVGLVLERLPVKAAKAMALLVYALITAFLVYLIVFGIKLSISTIHRTFNGMYWMSYVWVTISVPISASFMLVTAATRLRAILRSDDPKVIAAM